MTNDPVENRSIVLIVDDSLTNLAAFSEYLARLNCEVLVAINGVDALAQLEERKPDIILLDVIMPGIDGFETCRRIKKNPETKDIPLIFMTTLADTVDKVRGLSLGAVDYITKPFQEEEVVARIKTHITVNRLQKELRAQNTWLQQEIKERREAEDELQRRNHELLYSETRFRDLVMSLSDWVWECDDRFFLTYSSDRVLDLLGYEVEEVVGKTPFEFMSIEETTDFETTLTQCMSDKAPLADLEHWVYHKEGHSICLQTSGLPVFDHMGRVIGYRGASKDVTERKQMEQIAREYNTMLEMEVAERTGELEENNQRLEKEIAERQQIEAALRLSEERLNLAIHGAHYGIWDWSLDSDELYLSPRWKSLLGYEEHELSNTSAERARLIHPEDQSQAETAAQDYLAGKAPMYENIFRMQHKNGQYLWMLERGVAVWDELREHPIRFVGTLMDLTSQKQAETGLQESEERFELALRASDEGIWDWSLKHNSVSFSNGWKHMLGYGEHEIPEQFNEWQSRLHPDDQPRVMSAISDYLDKKQPTYRTVYRLRTRDDNWLWVLDRGIATWDGQGEATRFVGSCVDITDFKHTELQLRQRNEHCARVLQTIREAYWEWDRINNRAYFSPQWNQLIGYPEYENMGENVDVFRKRLAPEESESFTQALEDYLARKIDGFRYLHRLQHYDGHYLWVSSNAEAEWDEEDRPVYVLLAHRDVSAEHNLTQELEQTEGYYRELIQTAGLGLVLSQLDGAVLEANPAFTKMLGYSNHELCELNLFSSLTPEQYHGEDKEHLRELRLHGHFAPYRKTFLHRDGHEVPVRISGILVQKPDAQLIWMNVEKA